jgi:Holliday junction resolvase
MPIADGADFERILADIFRKAGWRVRRQPETRDGRADLIVSKGGEKYIVELKSASEGRSDRLIPLLSQAILQAQSFARRFPEPATPLAVVAARHIPASVADNLKRFAERNAPDIAVGVIDAEGFRSFIGVGLEGLDVNPPGHSVRHIASPAHIPDLFSDLNQWMLKVLLGQRLPATLISIPREPIRNASRLAAAANVSIMSASRLVNQLTDRGFLDREQEHLQVVRAEELLDRWTSSNREAAKEVPARWIIRGGEHQLVKALREYASRPMHNQPRCCLGLFAAADALGFGFVRGTPAHIYLENLTLDSLNRLGLAIEKSDRAAEVIVRIPSQPEAIFRPAVSAEGIPVSDVLQVWLDVATHPARGREQAREIQRQVLKPLFEKQG